MCACARVSVCARVHKLVWLPERVHVCLSVYVHVCVRVCGSPRGLPQAYHTQAVRDELPESKRGRERKEGGGRKRGKRGCCLRSGQRLVCVVSGFLLPPPSFLLHTQSAGKEKCEAGIKKKEGGKKTFEKDA